MPVVDQNDEGRFTKGKKEMYASYLIKCLFATNKTYRLVFSIPKSIRKTYLHIPVGDGCTGVKVPPCLAETWTVYDEQLKGIFFPTFKFNE